VITQVFLTVRGWWFVVRPTAAGAGPVYGFEAREYGALPHVGMGVEMDVDTDLDGTGRTTVPSRLVLRCIKPS
jgi:hypothetical protein